MKNENNLEDSKQSLFGLSRRGFLAGLPYNVRHKLLKQEPFVLNFLQFFYIHYLHPCSHSNNNNNNNESLFHQKIKLHIYVTIREDKNYDKNIYVICIY